MAMAITVPRYTVADLEEFPDDGNRYELLAGLLLVTPAPGAPHQRISARLFTMLSRALISEKHAVICAPGVISIPDFIHLEPDLLVVPGRYSINTPWTEMTEHWLAVEIISRSSRKYDRDFKRDAYIKLGVHEVWLVDFYDKSVEVCRAVGEGEVVRDGFDWHVPALNLHTAIDLETLFEGLP
ncbi:MAG: Uma2 family endonuclease [Gemmatimonadaceae bacterium]